jgi:hypothetical protein
MISLIPTIKIIDLDIKEFHLIKKNIIYIFLNLKWPKNSDPGLRRCFVSFFGVVFFYKVIYEFIKVFMLFYKCFRLKINF